MTRLPISNARTRFPNRRVEVGASARLLALLAAIQAARDEADAYANRPRPEARP